MRVLNEGQRKRVVRLTEMNASSSRSHAVLLITLYDAGRVRGRVTVVDLAGSERLKRTKSDGQRRKEAQAINLSLTCLGNVVHALGEKRPGHVPYRACKLTRILRHSLCADTLTRVIITISPSLADVPETLTSLHFGLRALSARPTPATPTLSHSTPRGAAGGGSAEAQRWERRCLALEEEMRRDQGLAEQLEAHVQRLSSQLREQTYRADAAEGRLQDLEGELAELQTDDQADSPPPLPLICTSEVELRAELDAAKAEISILRRENVRLEGWLEESRAEAQSSQDRNQEVEALKEQLEAKTAEFEGLQQQFVRASAEVKEDAAKTKKSEEEVECLRRRLSEVEAEAVGLRQGMAQLKEQLEGESGEAEDLRQEVEVLRALLDEAQGGAGKLRLEAGALRDRAQEYRHKLEEAQGMLRACAAQRRLGSPPTPIVTSSRAGSLGATSGTSSTVSPPHSPCHFVDPTLVVLHERLQASQRECEQSKRRAQAEKEEDRRLLASLIRQRDAALTRAHPRAPLQTLQQTCSPELRQCPIRNSGSVPTPKRPL
eukprot:Hpha_TRINITY_DN16631_c1_g1::TRINITY_DN16631_c1_g1_i2::g.178895::m.178895/K10396/KIF5; kinesin family member 5